MLRARARRQERSGRSADLLAVGLGNPGASFTTTRHNVGADAIEILATRHDVTMRSERSMSARVAEVVIEGRRLALAVPETFMNDSGVAVSALLRRYGGDDVGRLLIVHDELDLDPGVVRVKVGGGTAGHNGLRSIESHLRTLEFCRVRIGIGKPPGRMPGADYVLRRPSSTEREVLNGAVVLAADAVELVLEKGSERAMNAMNTR